MIMFTISSKKNQPVQDSQRFWRGKKVLVTGSEGFIGSHLTQLLVELGADVRAFVFYNSFGSWGWLEDLPEDIRKELDVFSGDIRESDSVRQAMKGREIVFHLAALIGIPYSYITPASYISTNIQGTLNLLQSALDVGVEKFIHTSTSEVYGTAKYVPIDENHPLQGQSPYSASKIGADKIAESFFCSFNLPVATIRPFNTFGPRQSARAVIPTIISQALTKDVIELGSTHPRRDFTFVMDTVRAFIRMAEVEEVIGEVVNIGTGREISIEDLVKVILNLMGRNLKISIRNERQRPAKSEVDRLLADTTLAKKLLKWEPVYTLEEGLSETIAWVSAHINTYRPKDYSI